MRRGDAAVTTEALWSRIATVRRRMVGLTWGEGALRVAAWAVAAVALGMLADWLWELPRLVRLLPHGDRASAGPG